MFTQSLWLEISFPLLSHSSPSPLSPTFSQLSRGSLGPKPTARVPAPSRAHLPSASHTACSPQCSFPTQTLELLWPQKGRWWLRPKDRALLLLLLFMGCLYPDAAGCTLSFHLCPKNCALGTHPHLTCSHCTVLPACQFPGQTNMPNHWSARVLRCTPSLVSLHDYPALTPGAQVRYRARKSVTG